MRARFRLSGEPAQPYAVRPEKMIERRVDGAEERAALGTPGGVGQLTGGVVDALVLPTVVSRHSAGVIDGDHSDASLSGVE